MGFKPPYFYHRAVRERLHRAGMPALVIAGEHDRMVPRAHSDAYVAGLTGASSLRIVPGAGHAAPLEAPDATATLLIEFLRDSKATTLQRASAGRMR
jgi:pimeloyl-ACP methyl ester carboxylesterase